MTRLLFDEQYIAFLRRTHPHLRICVTDDGASYYSASINITEVLGSSAKRFVARQAAGIASWLTHPRMTLFGLPFEPYVQTAVIDRLPPLSTLKSIAKREGSDLIGLTNICPSTKQAQLLVEHGFSPLPSFPDMSVTLVHKAFDDYLHALEPKQRQDIRRNLRCFTNAGHRMREAPREIPAVQLHDAYCATRLRAKIAWLEYSAAYFSEWSLACATSKISIAESSSGEFLGFVHLILDEDDLHVARLAIATAWHKRDAIYFCLLYRAIEEGCALGVRRIMLGPSTYRAKRRIGARPYQVYNYFLPLSTQWRFSWMLLKDFMMRELRYMQSTTILERMKF